MQGYLPDLEREEFVACLVKRRTRTLEELSRKIRFSSTTLRAWFSGARIRRSSAEKVRVRLGITRPRPEGLDGIVADLRGECSLRSIKELLCRAAVMLAEAAGHPGALLQLGDHPRLHLGSSEIIFGRIKGIACYRVLDEGVLCFEGTLSSKAGGMVREFLAWRDARDRGTAALKDKVNNTYAKF